MCIFRGLRVNNLFHRFYKGSNTRIKHDDRNDHGAEIFDPSISERMLFIRLFCCQLCPHDGDQRTSRIGNIVYRIQRNGNRIRQKTDCRLKCRKENICNDPDHAGPDDRFLPGAFCPDAFFHYHLLIHRSMLLKYKTVAAKHLLDKHSFPFAEICHKVTFYSFATNTKHIKYYKQIKLL